MTHSYSYVIEMPEDVLASPYDRLVVICIPYGDYSINFDEAAALHESLSVSLARFLDPTPLPEPEDAPTPRPRDSLPKHITSSNDLF